MIRVTHPDQNDPDCKCNREHHPHGGVGFHTAVSPQGFYGCHREQTGDQRPKEQAQGITRAKHQIRTDHAGEHRVRQGISHQRLATENQKVAQEGAAHKHQNRCEQREQIESGNQIHGSDPCRS